MPSPKEIALILGVSVAGTAVAATAILLYQMSKRRQKTPEYTYSPGDFLELQRRIDLLERNIQYLQERLEIRTQPVLKSSASLTSTATAEEDFQEAFEYLNSEDTADAETKFHIGDNLATLFDQTDTLLESKSDADKLRAYKLLEAQYTQFCTDPDFLWRLARATYLYSQTLINGTSTLEQRKTLCYLAKEYAYQALKLKNDDANVHKWCALTVGTICDFVGTKERIRFGYEFKLHIDEALRLNPSDSICHHLLGRWCYGVASLTWIERKVASALFGEPPVSSYEESLKEFLLAQQDQDNGWAENELFIAKCHLGIGDKCSAERWLLAATKSPQTSADDRAAASEAAKMLETF